MLAPLSPGPAPPAALALFPAGGAGLPEDPGGFGAAIEAVEAEEAPEAAAPDALALLLPLMSPPVAATAALPAGADSAVAPASGTPTLPDAPALQLPAVAEAPGAEAPAAPQPPATEPAARPNPAARAMAADRPDARPPAGPETAETAPAAPKAGGAAESALRHLLTEGQIAAPQPPDAPPQPVVTEAAPSPARAAPAATPAPPPQHQAAGALAALIRDSGAQVAGDARRIELVLTPEDLGRIRFDLTPGRDGLQVTLAAERPETLDLLRRHAGDLLAELEAAGYGGATLNFGSGGNAPAAFAAPEPGPEPTETPPTAPLPQPRPVLRAAGGLDLRL